MSDSASVETAASLPSPDLDTTETVLQVRGLRKYFNTDGERVSGKRTTSVLKAVDNISFSIRRGESLGLVGESGCGKSTAGKTILRIEEPTEGHIIIEGHDMQSLSASEMRQMRRKVQMVFQDPYSSLNPRHKVWQIITEPLAINTELSSKERYARALELLDRVGLKGEQANRYPHQFSGGQRQRIGIARALALQPSVIVLDEPVSALDVSIQAAIINLLKDLQRDFNLTLLFISHDLAVVRHMCNRVAVMYLGQLVEVADVEQLFTQHAHPYTTALLEAIPDPDPRNERNPVSISGDVPNPTMIEPGCRFKSRCPQRHDQCDQDPPLFRIGEGHLSRCWKSREISTGQVADDEIPV